MKPTKLTGRGGPGRGQGRIALDSRGDTKQITVTLDQKTMDELRLLGRGNLSRGIRRAAMLIKEITE